MDPFKNIPYESSKGVGPLKVNEHSANIIKTITPSIFDIYTVAKGQKTIASCNFEDIRNPFLTINTNTQLINQTLKFCRVKYLKISSTGNIICYRPQNYKIALKYAYISNGLSRRHRIVSDEIIAKGLLLEYPYKNIISFVERQCYKTITSDTIFGQEKVLNALIIRFTDISKYIKIEECVL